MKFPYEYSLCIYSGSKICSEEQKDLTIALHNRPFQGEIIEHNDEFLKVIAIVHSKGSPLLTIIAKITSKWK
jgi:predicted ATP-grasp superfamily ATP-dependent carboligase